MQRVVQCSGVILPRVEEHDGLLYRWRVVVMLRSEPVPESRLAGMDSIHGYCGNPVPPSGGLWKGPGVWTGLGRLPLPGAWSCALLLTAWGLPLPPFSRLGPAIPDGRSGCRAVSLPHQAWGLCGHSSGVARRAPSCGTAHIGQGSSSSSHSPCNTASLESPWLPSVGAKCPLSPLFFWTGSYPLPFVALSPFFPFWPCLSPGLITDFSDPLPPFRAHALWHTSRFQNRRLFFRFSNASLSGVPEKTMLWISFQAFLSANRSVLSPNRGCADVISGPQNHWYQSSKSPLVIFNLAG